MRKQYLGIVEETLGRSRGPYSGTLIGNEGGPVEALLVCLVLIFEGAVLAGLWAFGLSFDESQNSA